MPLCVTVVNAGASMKMNRLRLIRLFQTWTLPLTMTFVVSKSFEYHDKFTHYEVVLKNGTSMTGHIEGSPMFWNLQKLNAGKIESFTFHPDAHQAGHPDNRAEAGETKGAHEAIKIATADIAKLESYGPWHNTYLAIYFTLTGLHALHVIAGALVIGCILATS